MKKAVITGVRRAELVEVPTPRPKDDWVLVKIHTAPMCTEYKGFLAGRGDNLGHEAVGEVVAIDRAARVRVGDRVVVMPSLACGQCGYCLDGDYIHCRHPRSTQGYLAPETGASTYAQYILKPEFLLMPIPDGMDYDLAGLSLCALGPSFGALDKLAASAFDTVLVSGLGPVGMGAIVNARFRNLRVIAIDPLPYRRGAALELEAGLALSPDDPDLAAKVRAFAGADGVDCAIECSGAPAAHRLAIDLLRPLGGLAIVGESNADTVIHASDDMIRKGISIVGNWHYNGRRYGALTQVIERSPLAKKLITHALPMTQIQRAMEISASPEHIKIMLHPWDD